MTLIHRYLITPTRWVADQSQKNCGIIWPLCYLARELIRPLSCPMIFFCNFLLFHSVHILYSLSVKWISFQSISVEKGKLYAFFPKGRQYLNNEKLNIEPY